MKPLFIIFMALFLPAALLAGQVNNPSVSKAESPAGNEQVISKLPSEDSPLFKENRISLRVGPGDGEDGERIPTEEAPIKEGTVTIVLLAAIYATATALINRKKMREKTD